MNNKLFRKIWIWIVSSYLNIYGKIILWLLTRNIDDKHKALYKTVLTNQMRYNISGREWNRQQTGSLTLSVASSILDKLVILQNFMGIQPMNSPVSLVYNLHTRASDQPGRQTLEISSSPIEARSRKLSARWSHEGLRDLKPVYATDVEKEIKLALGDEIVTEIICEQIHNITQHSTDSGSTSINGLIDKIREVRHSIQRSSLRGPANFMIVDSVTASNLQLLTLSDGNGKIHRVGKNIKSGGFVVCMGDWIDTSDESLPPIKVFVNQLQDEPRVLMGYKGIGETDTGYVYSPYVLLMSTGLVMDPHTFEPTLAFMTRYGMHFTEEDVGKYYAKFTVEQE